MNECSPSIPIPYRRTVAWAMPFARVFTATLTVLLALLLVLALSGCATPYDRMGLTGGIAVLPLEKHKYQITVDGNHVTKLDRANELALLKAAELTLSAGQERFLIEEESVELDREKALSWVERGSLWSFFLPNPHKGGGSIIVRVLTAADPDYGKGLDARGIYRGLAPKYINRPKF